MFQTSQPYLDMGKFNIDTQLNFPMKPNWIFVPLTNALEDLRQQMLFKPEISLAFKAKCDRHQGVKAETGQSQNSLIVTGSRWETGSVSRKHQFSPQNSSWASKRHGYAQVNGIHCITIVMPISHLAFIFAFTSGEQRGFWLKPEPWKDPFFFRKKKSPPPSTDYTNLRAKCQLAQKSGAL